MWWILASMSLSFLWMAYEYRRAPMVDENEKTI